MPPPLRHTVDLSAYPDLVVIYLGMQPTSLHGARTLRGLAKEIRASVMAQPDGLLLHENLHYSLWPIHRGMRQVWRDLDSLERWTRSMPHRTWWNRFLRDPSGTIFWHEAYFMRGGIDAVYVHMPTSEPYGLMKCTPVIPATGAMFGTRGRAGHHASTELAAVIAEPDL
jgi:hypothetical protein